MEAAAAVNLPTAIKASAPAAGLAAVPGSGCGAGVAKQAPGK